MEKRLALAFILSFAVLYIWFGMNPAPQPVPQQLEEPQVVEKQDVVDSDLSPVKSASIPVEPLPVAPESYYISNDKIDVELSNIGGSIRTISLKNFNEHQPFSDLLLIHGFGKVPFKVISQSDTDIKLRYEDDEISISRVYEITNSYLINAKTIIRNKSNMSKMIDLGFKGIKLDMSSLDIKSVEREKSLFEYVVNSENGFVRKNNAYKFSEKNTLAEDGKINWVAFRDRYFCTIVKPLDATKSYALTSHHEKNLNIEMYYGDIVLPPSGDASYSAIIYSGPEELSTIKEYGYGFEDIKKFYRFVLFDAIAKIIYEFLHWIHNFIPNWGVCILLISAIIYFSMYPLTLRSMESMRKMQKLQPKMTEMREKYKDNPQRLNKEMMEIYKTERINPLGGCIPILFQMPVFIGLYQVLWRDVSFKGADFLWIKDLSEPDRLFILPFEIPFMGNEINILPIFMMAVMFVQTRLQAKNMTTTDPQQQTQQKLMGWIMPIFLGVIFYKFASGLTLYFTMFYLFSTATQWKMSKKVD